MAVPVRARPRSAPAPTAPPQDRSRWWIEGLDAWRALAIIAVLIFHLRPQTLPGGFIGVDVFFVISGFLITTLLIRELQKHGRINLPQFWVRRARRLLPALVTVVLVSTVVAFFAGGDLLVGIRRHILGALTFSNNWVEIAHGSDYFAASTPNLFMNFWSLAVEEQFYLLWPVLAIVIMAALPTGKARVWLLGGGALASALAMVILYDPDAVTRVYYGTDTHAFGLLLGAGLAFAMAAPDITFFDTELWQRLRVPLALGGFAVVITLMLTVDGEGGFAYRGGLVIASLATGLMVAALPGKPTALTRVLKARPLEWVGVRSYGIYMWHWPAILIVDAAWPAAAPDSPSWWFSRGVALAATLSLAALSLTYIENPVRKLGFIQVGRNVTGWLGRIPHRGKTFVGIVTGSFAILFLIAVIAAPTQSTLEQSMIAAAKYVETADSSVPTPAPSADIEEAAADDPEGGGSEAEPANDETLTGEAAPEEEPAPAGETEGEAAPATEGPLVVHPSEIYGVGDSMMYVAAPGLSQALPGMVINAESNRQWPAVLDQLRAAVANGKAGPVVVIAAGTNAGASDISLVEKAVEILGPERRIVLVNIYSRSTFVEATNENYRAVAQAHPNVAVADWHGAASAHAEQLQPDRIHPNMAGMHLWAAVVIEALAELDVTVSAD